MGIILSLALALRLIFFNQSLWLDESIEALALMGKLGPLLSYALADYQPPLYHLIGYIITHLLGYSEMVLRLPSLISGIFTVYFVFKIGEFIMNKRAGVIAGLLTATSPLLVYYSGEGRTYAMTTFFVTASFYYLLKLVKSKSTKFSLLYFIFTTCFIWTSYLSWFVLLAQGIYILQKKRYDILLLQVISGLTLSLWLPSFIGSLGVGRYTLGLSSAWGMVVGGLTWKSLPLTWVKFVIGRISFDNKILYGFIMGVLLILHLSILKRVAWKKYSFLLWWVIPPIILGLAVASILPVYSYFRVLFALPGYILLLTLGMHTLDNNRFLICLLLGNLIFLTISWTSPRFRHEDWRTLANDLLQEPDTLIGMPSHEQNPGLLYYGIEESRIFEPQKVKIIGNRIYYVRYAEDLFDVSKTGQANFLSSGYTITSQKTYPGIQVDIYENSH